MPPIPGFFRVSSRVLEREKPGMLTDTKCRTAKATAKPVKLTDSGGLHLYVTPAGGKHWRYRYEFDGREKVLSIGPYPAVSLTDARVAREDAKAAQRAGRDPSVAKRLEKVRVSADDSATFEVLAREWHKLNKSKWGPIHADDVLHSLERDAFPEIGPLPVREITAPVILALLRKIEARSAIETARRVRQRMSAVFVYAIASGRGENDPAAIVRDALAPLVKGRQPAITDLGEARAMLAKAEAEPAHAVTKLALRFLALTNVRPGTLTGTPWTEFDNISDDVWCIPAARMKLKLDRKKDETRDHLVPLSTQALDVLAVLKTLTGDGPLVFPNMRHAHKPMSENAIGYLLNRAGYHHRHVPHGWRSTFSTVMNERCKEDRAVIDLMLAHVPGNRVEGAYNRAAYLARRKELAQIWADLILKDAKPAASLLEGPRR
jgi:integrase